MNIVLCDDKKFITEQVYHELNIYFNQQKIQADMDCYCSAEEAMRSKRSYDMAFLDIDLGRVDGIALAEQLKERNRNIFIFFITSHPQYLDEAFDVGAFRFFEKPIDTKRLHSGLEHALRKYQKGNPVISCSCAEGTLLFHVTDIIYLYIENRKVNLVTQTKVFSTKMSMNEWKELLLGHNFSQPHNSYLVNLKYVYAFSGDTIIMEKGDKKEIVYVSRRKKKEFQKEFAEMMEKNYDEL